jgi:hypothetical protein
MLSRNQTEGENGFNLEESLTSVRLRESRGSVHPLHSEGTTRKMRTESSCSNTKTCPESQTFEERFPSNFFEIRRYPPRSGRTGRRRPIARQDRRYPIALALPKRSGKRISQYCSCDIFQSSSHCNAPNSGNRWPGKS